MKTDDVVQRAERELRKALVELVGPRRRECLSCFLTRVVDAHGCDGTLAWTHRWQGYQRMLRIRTGGLTRYLKNNGGFCDCEALMNVYPNRHPEQDAEGGCSHAPKW